MDNQQKAIQAYEQWPEWKKQFQITNFSSKSHTNADRVIYYTGIGSRTPPQEISSKFYNLAKALGEPNEHGPHFVLRSGGADGADTSFELGCDAAKGSKQILLPWKGFNGNHSSFYQIPEQAFKIAADVYGKHWSRLKSSTKKFMARNVQQVLGPELNYPSSFVVCWTPDGCRTADQRSNKTGGTGQAIALASELDIPVLNLYNPEDVHILYQCIEHLVEGE